MLARSAWIVSDLLLGHFVVFWASFMSVLAFDAEDFDKSIVFGTVASVVLMGLAIATTAAVNAVLRLINRDVSRRSFWWVSAALCIVGAAAAWLIRLFWWV